MQRENSIVPHRRKLLNMAIYHTTALITRASFFQKEPASLFSAEKISSSFWSLTMTTAREIKEEDGTQSACYMLADSLERVATWEREREGQSGARRIYIYILFCVPHVIVDNQTWISPCWYQRPLRWARRVAEEIHHRHRKRKIKYARLPPNSLLCPHKKMDILHIWWYRIECISNIQNLLLLLLRISLKKKGKKERKNSGFFLIFFSFS